MDGEYGSGMGKEKVVMVDRFEISRDQSGLPLMMMDDIRGEPHALTKNENGSGEEYETFRIVKVVTFGCAVEIFSVEELFPADEIDRDVLAKMAQVNIRIELLISDGNFDLLSQILKRVARSLHDSVIRHD
jgi:hypothetical protein